MMMFWSHQAAAMDAATVVAKHGVTVWMRVRVRVRVGRGVWLLKRHFHFKLVDDAYHRFSPQLRRRKVVNNDGVSVAAVGTVVDGDSGLDACLLYTSPSPRDRG